jgi:2-dehydropantoate 2-reductase
MRAGHPVVLVDQWYESIEAIRRRGLAVTVDGVRSELKAQALYPDELRRLEERAQVVLLACKSYDTEPMVRAVGPYLADDGFVVSLQNGINEDLIAELLGARRTVGCVVHYNGGMFEPGHAVRYSPSAWHSYTVGELDGRQGDRIDQVTSLLSAAGKAASTTDIFGTLWAKLAVNCMLNGLTAVSGLDTAAVWQSRIALDLMAKLATEAAKVASRQGRNMRPVHLVATGLDMSAELLLAAVDDPDAHARVHYLMSREAAARAAASQRGGKMVTSMLQDVSKRRRPEIDYLNGYVVSQGAGLGIDTPANEAIARLLHLVATGDERQDPAHLMRIAETLDYAEALPHPHPQ